MIKFNRGTYIQLNRGTYKTKVSLSIHRMNFDQQQIV